MLWKKLRARSLRGYQFNRQKPLDNYIVDFYCQALHLVIEIDGEYHKNLSAWVKDQDRQMILENLGLNFIRFSEKEVCKDITNVLNTIEFYISNFEELFPEAKEKAERKTKKFSGK